MGTLYYGAGRTPIHVDDAVLAHLKVVTTTKLRRGEGFLLSWTDSAEIGDGRSSVWIYPNCDLHYKFSGKIPPKLDTGILEEMTAEAHQHRGIELKDASLAYSSRGRRE